MIKNVYLAHEKASFVYSEKQLSKQDTVAVCLI